jgi:outer membrane receptor for ferrienterochelin and colicin
MRVKALPVDRFRTSILVLLLAACILAGQEPQTSKPERVDDPISLDLESLLNTKVTTASKFGQSLADAPGVVSVVSQDELRRFGGMTLAEILGRVAGLSASSGFLGDRALIAVHGEQTRADEGHVLILINGRPVREVLEGGVSTDIMQSFPIGVLERIEVVKGPGSVLYGSGAFSGVINLITKKGAGRDYRVSASGGGSGEAAGSEQILFERGAFNLVEGAQYRQNPRWDTLYRGYLVPSHAIGSQQATLRDEGSGAFLAMNYKGFSFESSYTAAEEASFVRETVGDERWKRGFADLGYAVKATGKWDMTLNFTYSRAILDAPDYPQIHRDSDEQVAEWTNFVTFSDKDKLTIGALYNFIRGTETFYGVTPALVVANGSRPGESFYVQHEHRLTDSLKLIGGMQANKTGKLSVDVVPRGGILWNMASHWTCKVLYSGAYRAPSLDETLLHHPGLQGNPDLLPERVGTFDVQVSYRNKRAQADVGYFHSRQTNPIVADGSTVPSHYYNLGGAATFQGLDAEGKFYLRNNWLLTASLLYQTNRDGMGVSNFTPIPSLGAKAGVSYQTQRSGELSLFDDYEGHLAGYAGALNPRPVAALLMDAHARFDLSKRWLKDSPNGFALFAQANNLLDKQVWMPALGTGQFETIPVVRGRTVYFGVEVWRKKE